MPETNTITDANLLALIQTSALLDSQKKDLSGLVTFMTASERRELINLIDEAGKASEEKTKINTEYAKKVKEVSRSESEYVRKEFEKFDTNLTSGDFAVMESEMLQIRPGGQTADPIMSGRTNRAKAGTSKKHTVRNMGMFLIFIVMLVSAILYGISYLNNI